MNTIKTPNYKDSALKVSLRQNLGFKSFWIGIFYIIDGIFPETPLPGSLVGVRIRSAIARKIFKYTGKDVTVHKGVNFGSGINIVIGDYSSLNYNCRISNDTEIGSDVMMGPDVLILSGSHNFQSIDIPMREQGAPSRRPVKIGNDVWIGARSIILPGVEIGSHSIIGAGSVVTKSIPSFSVYAGNPARLIRSRNAEIKDD